MIVLGAGVYYGVRAGLSRFFFDNPDYQLSTIAVRTDGTLQRDQVLKAGALREGLNIFSVNLAQVRDRLQQLPQIDEVQVERKMPNEIDITITERKPIAWITSEQAVADPFASEAAFLVDARGILMKEKNCSRNISPCPSSPAARAKRSCREKRSTLSKPKPLSSFSA